MTEPTSTPEPVPGTLRVGDTLYETTLTPKFLKRKPYQPPDPKKVVCVIPGVVQKIYVRPGQRVARSESLCVLEAMKMQNDVLSSGDGTILSVHVSEGEMVTKGQILMEFV